MDWVLFGYAIYCMVAFAILLFVLAEYDGDWSWPDIFRMLGDGVFWPFWFLLLIVEATEEARRRW